MTKTRRSKFKGRSMLRKTKRYGSSVVARAPKLLRCDNMKCSDTTALDDKDKDKDTLSNRLWSLLGY
jgi:hypothetical protein